MSRCKSAIHWVCEDAEAAKLLRSAPTYGLVLMDITMPEMDGYAAIKEICSAEITIGRHIPIIAMTANATQGNPETCIASGMDDYISKPVRRETLRDMLQRWLPLEQRILTADDAPHASH